MLKNVLIVEDSSLLTKMYHMVFKAYPECKLVIAGNGLEALDKLATVGEISLIILDINMPKMNGLAFLEEMAKAGYADIPVIVISTEGEDADIKRALSLGAKGYIKKPWKPEQIHSLIGKVVNA